MCLDAQGGIKAKRQPFVAGVVLSSCVLDAIGEMCLCTFCQMLVLRILTFSFFFHLIFLFLFSFSSRPSRRHNQKNSRKHSVVKMNDVL